jgi:tetratricopeptide (TPR) repeat protein
MGDLDHKTYSSGIGPSSIGITLYVVIFFSFLLYFLIQWPIIGLDTDLWYHLNSGRFIITHHSIPHTSFFSFIDPPREYTDYYWFFQALVYQIYSLGGYFGLVLLRTGLYLFTITLVLLYLFKNRQQINPYVLLILFTLYAFVLFFRFELVRPHAFSYLLIILFLYILEYQAGKSFLLLPLAILWINLHGIEYPVMLLILLAYLSEWLFNRRRTNTPLSGKELFYVLPLVFSLLALFATPHGSKLIAVPFTSIEHTRQYIAEFKTLTISDLLTFQLAEGPSSPLTLFNILWPLTLIALITSLWKKCLRISHLLLFLGGVFLVLKGFRFTYEFVLLTLPLLKGFLPLLSWSTDRKKAGWVFIPLLILVLLPPLYGLKKNVDQKPRFPFSGSRFPQGVAAFLNQVPAQGRILNNPNDGGYLQWMLYPRYKIFMDMEVPFLFKDEDFLLATDALLNEEILKKFILKYDPSFITVPMINRSFKEIIKKFPDYILVFFDSQEVLYLNQRHYPQLAYQYALKEMDPYGFFDKPIERIITESNKGLVTEQLSGMTKIFPDCLLTNQLLAMILNGSREYAQAIPHADRIIQNYPENYIGYLLKGDALKGLKQIDQAIGMYQMALPRVKESDRPRIFRVLAYAYSTKGDYPKAYASLKKGIKFFAVTTSFEDLFDLSSLALRLGDSQEGLQLLRYAYQKVPLENAEWRTRIEKQFQLLGVSY